jgi:ERCC4-type nuclease
MDGGDIAFWGNGPDDEPWFFGIEFKKVNDLVDCMRSGRFAGTQLPRMQKLFNLSFLLIEGAYEANLHDQFYDGNYRLWVPRGGGYGTSFGTSFKAFDSFTTMIAVSSALSGQACIVKRAKNRKESIEVIKGLYGLFQKQWHEHTSMGTFDRTKLIRIQPEIDCLDIKPDDAEYPTLILRKALFQIRGIGWREAGVIAGKYKTFENILAAGQRDFEALENVGTIIAKRVYTALHGREDASVKLKARRKKSENL